MAPVDTGAKGAQMSQKCDQRTGTGRAALAKALRREANHWPARFLMDRICYVRNLFYTSIGRRASPRAGEIGNADWAGSRG